jgi:Tfp pilus assembly protein PilX
MNMDRARGIALIVLLALLVTLTLSLAACGGYQSSPSNPGAPTPTQGSGY